MFLSWSVFDCFKWNDQQRSKTLTTVGVELKSSLTVVELRVGVTSTYKRTLTTNQVTEICE